MDCDEEIDAMLSEGKKVGEIAKVLAGRGLGERQELYARAAARKRAFMPKGTDAPRPEPGG